MKFLKLEKRNKMLQIEKARTLKIKQYHDLQNRLVDTKKLLKLYQVFHEDLYKDKWALDDI